MGRSAIILSDMSIHHQVRSENSDIMSPLPPRSSVMLLLSALSLLLCALFRRCGWAAARVVFLTISFHPNALTHGVQGWVLQVFFLFFFSTLNLLLSTAVVWFKRLPVDVLGSPHYFITLQPAAAESSGGSKQQPAVWRVSPSSFAAPPDTVSLLRCI